MTIHNENCTCWSCPAVNLKGMVDFRACGQSVSDFRSKHGLDDGHIVAECKRRPQDGLFEPTVTYERCPEWKLTPYGYMLKDMKVMICGIDGYLGFTLALHLGSLGFRVSGVDNLSRRKWVRGVGSHSIIPISSMKKRLKVAKDVLSIDINFKRLDILKDRERLKRFIIQEQPEAIVHYGECPSAPYSMKSVEHALFVQKNNVLGTLGLLFSMRNTVPESSLIKLATMGEYNLPLTGRPIFEGFFPGDAVLKWRGQEWSLGGEITPRAGGSFYHISKIHDTFNVKAACLWWHLRSIDVHQGVIYGVHTPQLDVIPELRTRFDICSEFGTSVNRMVSQAVLGIPLTIFGSGDQIRGFIALGDAIQAMTRLLVHPGEPGQYQAVNQMSGYFSIRELAETVRKVGKDFGLDVKIQRLENPRIEPENHPFNPVYENLKDVYGFEPRISLEEEIGNMFKLLTQPEIKARIEAKRDHILPSTWWSGETREVKQIGVAE